MSVIAMYVVVMQLLQGASVGTTLEFLADYSITDENVVEGNPTNNQRTVSHLRASLAC